MREGAGVVAADHSCKRRSDALLHPTSRQDGDGVPGNNIPLLPWISIGCVPILRGTH